RTEAPGNTARGGAVGHRNRAACEPDQSQFRDAVEEYAGGGPQTRVRTPRSECQRANRFRDGLYKAARTEGERVDYRPRRIFQCRKRTACGTNGPPCDPRDLPVAGVRCGWWPVQLRRQPGRCVAPGRRLCRTNPEGRETCRATG